MENLNKEVLAAALANNICGEWAEFIKNADIHQLLKMYLRGIDFCLDNNFPHNDFLKEKGGSLLAEYGIFIDEDTLQQSRSKLVALGTCNIDARYSDYNVSAIFAKHASKLNVSVIENAIVTIDAFDNSFLYVVAAGNAQVLVNLYGNAKISYTSTGNAAIKVVQKHKNTY